jgi:hypothetical protein
LIFSDVCPTRPPPDLTDSDVFHDELLDFEVLLLACESGEELQCDLSRGRVAGDVDETVEFKLEIETCCMSLMTPS